MKPSAHTPALPTFRIRPLRRFLLALGLVGALTASAQAPTPTERQMQELGLVRLHDVDPSIRVSLGLARADNPAGRPLYTDLHDAWLTPQAAQALKRAQARLKREHPELSLKVYDAARPLSVQAQLYRAVAGKMENIYVSSPQTGGDPHNYGLAVDVTLCQAASGDTLTMGTRIGDFVPASRAAAEAQAADDGGISAEARTNRELLRRVMAAAGFKPLRTQWWHFNFRTRSEAKANFRLIR